MSKNCPNFIEVASDPVAVDDLVKYFWQPVLAQKMVLVCSKSGTDEIVGLNTNFVKYKDENFYDYIKKQVNDTKIDSDYSDQIVISQRFNKLFVSSLISQFKSDKNVRQFDALFFMGENFNICEHYGVDKYLSCAGLVVSSKYRGRRIGEHLLSARKAVCKHFGIKLTSTPFTSNYSNKIADKVGFKLDKFLR